MATTKRPRKNHSITFLDIGSGPTADAGWKLAKNRERRNQKGRIVSVDHAQKQLLTNKRGQVIGQPHHSIFQADVFEYLAKTKPNSIKVINDSYFIDDNLIETLLKSKGKPIEIRFHETKKLLQAYAEQLYKVLVQNGFIEKVFIAG